MQPKKSKKNKRNAFYKEELCLTTLDCITAQLKYEKSITNGPLSNKSSVCDRMNLWG